MSDKDEPVRSEFRSATGQTGLDAYVYELTAIDNAARELKDRMRAVIVAAHTEHPELFDHNSDWLPFSASADRAGQFRDYLMARNG